MVFYLVITTQGSFSQPQAAQSSSHEININRCILSPMLL
nr:MAG TPA: hypothetical protein [Bacteriophage sp.]